MTEVLGEAVQEAASKESPHQSPIREVLSIRSYRDYWISSFLIALVNGTLRFTFIWLVITELTTWPPAAGVLGIALGIPALLVSLPAGALSDRADRKRLIIRGTVAATLLLVLTSLAILGERMTFTTAILLALAVSTALALITPALQAMVPMLVPRRRLMSGVALQNIGFQMAMFLGNLIGGAAIALFRTGGAFLVFAGISALGVFAMSRVDLPSSDATTNKNASFRADVREGLRLVVRTEPIRSLMLLNLLIGLAISFLVVNLPPVSERILGQGAFSTSVLFALLGLGMMSTSLFMASRRDARRLGLKVMVTLGFCLGPGVLLLGLSRSYPLTLAVIVVWGMCGGVAMAAHRSLVQSLTEDRMMGRIMGINALAMLGSFPVGALLSALAVGTLGPHGVLMAGGALITVAAAPLTVRRVIRTA